MKKPAAKRTQGGAAATAPGRYRLRLFISGATPRSTRAIANIKEIGKTRLQGNYDLEVIDAYQQAERVRDQQVVVLPTLIKELPLPLRRMVGDLSDEDRVLVGLGVVPGTTDRHRSVTLMPGATTLDRTIDALRRDNADLRSRLEASEEMLAAIRSGAVDAITVETPAGLRVFTLKSADEPYRVMVETMSEGAVTVTPDDVILYSNQRFADMLGTGLDTIIGSSLLAHFADDDAARVAAALAGSETETPRLEATLLASDGTRVPVNVAMRSHTNGATHVAAVITDLSELAASRGVLAATNLALERQLAGSRQQAALLDQAHDAIVVTDEHDRIQYWNRGAETMYGIPAASALGRDKHELLKTEFSGSFAEIEAELLRSGTWQGELVHTGGDGRKVVVASRWSLQRDPDGQPVAVLQIHRDITAQKAAQTQLHVALHYARSLIEASLDPLVTISADGKITSVNKATEAVTGVARKRLIGSDFSDYFTEPEKARAVYRQVFAEGSVTDYELAMRHTSGRITDVLYNASSYHDENGKVAGVFAAARDVTQRRRTEAELALHRQHLEELVAARTTDLAHANQGLKGANQELELFAYSVSHDLRTPLRAIDGFSQILVKDYGDKLDTEGKRILQVVRDGATRMGYLIDDILAFSRVGRQPIASAETDMGSLVQNTLRELAAAMDDRGIKIEVGKLPHVHGDPQMLQRVWTNLLENAIKFSGPKPNPVIEIGARAGDDETEFFVKDNGVGFDMKYVGKLFGVFQRLHSVEEFTGTGIGLAIVHRIVTRHGGRVRAEGKVGEGATFWFTLPHAVTDHA